MLYRESGTRCSYLKFFEHQLHLPYDYEEEGLMNKVLPPHVVAATAPTTQALIQFMDKLFTWLMKYVDELKQFKNYNYHQY